MENERADQLSDEEIAFIIRQDSIRDYISRKEYLDSVDQVFNKVTALKVLWWELTTEIEVKECSGQ